MEKGTIYKYTKNSYIIRPVRWGVVRRDVVYKKEDIVYNLGDQVQYEYYEKNGRRYAVNVSKI